MKIIYTEKELIKDWFIQIIDHPDYWISPQPAIYSDRSKIFLSVTNNKRGNVNLCLDGIHITLNNLLKQYFKRVVIWEHW